MNAGYETYVIYLDYAKAFDKVYHKLLLKKLKAYVLPVDFINVLDHSSQIYNRKL